LEKGEGGCRKDEINPDSACGRQSSGYTKGFFCETAFSPRTGLAKNGDSFHKLQTTFDPGQWAALASDQSNTHFQCLVRAEEDTLQQINCSKVLRICQYPRVKFALSNMGSYWVSTNKPQAKVIQDATKKGIYLKW